MRFAAMIPIGLCLNVLTADFARAEGPNSVAPPTAEQQTAPQASPLAKQRVPIEGEFGEGWEQTVELPATPATQGETVKLWVDQGLLHVRRESATNELDWQFILCRIEELGEPEIYVKDGFPFFEVRLAGGRYFIREIGASLRVLRQPGIAEQLLSKDEVLPSAERRGYGRAEPVNATISGWQQGDWFYAAIGPTHDRWTGIVRLNPMELASSGYGFESNNAGIASMFHGKTWANDDGELLVANRTRESAYIAHKKQEAARSAVLAGKLPALDATQWLNIDEPFTWESLKGKVVLVDFWGTWCGPCVAKLPELQPLHEKYAERGLAILAIHSANSSESCEEFIREHGFTFPVAIDSGKTAEEFAISGWPTYFLIDRAGKVVEGFNHATPTEETIVKLIDGTAE